MDPDRLRRALATYGGRVDHDRGHPRWWVTDPSPDATRTAEELGMVERRRLFQMRRPLPLDADLVAGHTVATRPFDASRDVDAWLEVNNAAFEWHPDQGGWTRATLEDHLRADWFDPEGFLVHDHTGDDGRPTMAGFCWTKVHPATHAEPPRGEIFVIAVAPAFAGRGLGTALTVAGLDHLWTRHATPVGMLYVEHDNHAAVATYRKLGFDVHSTDVAYEPASDGGAQ